MLGIYTGNFINFSYLIVVEPFDYNSFLEKFIKITF
jgi:hypothetical protein